MAENDAFRKTLSVNNVCACLNVSHRTVYNWINAGKIRFFRTPGGSLRFYEDEILLDSTRVEPPQSAEERAS